MSDKAPGAVEYEGDVVLRCQEGGFAVPSIECSDEVGGEARDVRSKLEALVGGDDPPKTLDQLLTGVFGDGSDSHGDVALGRLRIVVERARGADLDE